MVAKLVDFEPDTDAVGTGAGNVEQKDVGDVLASGRDPCHGLPIGQSHYACAEHLLVGLGGKDIAIAIKYLEAQLVRWVGTVVRCRQQLNIHVRSVLDGQLQLASRSTGELVRGHPDNERAFRNCQRLIARDLDQFSLYGRYLNTHLSSWGARQVSVSAHNDRNQLGFVRGQREHFGLVILELRGVAIDGQTHHHFGAVDGLRGGVDNLHVQLVHHTTFDRQARNNLTAHTREQNSPGHFHAIGIHGGDGVAAVSTGVPRVCHSGVRNGRRRQLGSAALRPHVHQIARNVSIGRRPAQQRQLSADLFHNKIPNGQQTCVQVAGVGNRGLIARRIHGRDNIRAMSGRRARIHRLSRLEAIFVWRQAIHGSNDRARATIQPIVVDSARKRRLPGGQNPLTSQRQYEVLRRSRCGCTRLHFDHRTLARDRFLSIGLPHGGNGIFVNTIRRGLVDVLRTACANQRCQHCSSRGLSVQLIAGRLLDLLPRETHLALSLGLGCKAIGHVQRRQIALIDLEPIQGGYLVRYVVQVILGDVAKAQALWRPQSRIRRQREARGKSRGVHLGHTAQCDWRTHRPRQQELELRYRRRLLAERECHLKRLRDVVFDRCSRTQNDVRQHGPFCVHPDRRPCVNICSTVADHIAR